MGVTKSEVKKALDEIRDMSDEEIADNCQFVRKVSEEALALIKNLERYSGICRAKPKTKNSKPAKGGDANEND